MEEFSYPAIEYKIPQACMDSLSVEMSADQALQKILTYNADFLSSDSSDTTPELHRAEVRRLWRAVSIDEQCPKWLSPKIKDATFYLEGMKSAAQKNDNNALITLVDLLLDKQLLEDNLTSDVQAQSGDYEQEFRAPLETGSPLPVYFNEQRIQQYILDQLDEFESHGKVGGAPAMRAILNSALLSLPNKLKLLAMIGEGKSNNSLSSLSRGMRRSDVKKFYEGLKQFSAVTSGNVTAAFTGFLRETGRIDAAVNPILDFKEVIDRDAIIRATQASDKSADVFRKIFYQASLGGQELDVLKKFQFSVAPDGRDHFENGTKQAFGLFYSKLKPDGQYNKALMKALDEGSDLPTFFARENIKNIFLAHPFFLRSVTDGFALVDGYSHLFDEEGESARQSIRTILSDAELPLHLKLQLVAEIAAGKNDSSKKMAPKVAGFYKGLECFIGVDKSSFSKALTGFMKVAVDDVKPEITDIEYVYQHQAVLDAVTKESPGVLFLTQVKRLVQLSINTSEPIQAQDIALIAVAPADEDLQACFDFLKESLLFKKDYTSGQINALLMGLTGSLREKIAKLTSMAIAELDATLINDFYIAVEGRHPTVSGASPVTAAQIAEEWREYVAQLPTRLQARASRVLSSVVIEQPQQFSLNPFSYEESLRARLLGAVPAFVALQRLGCTFRGGKRVDMIMGRYDYEEKNGQVKLTANSVTKQQDLEKAIIAKEIALGSKGEFDILVSDMITLLSGKITEFSLYACAKKYFEFLSIFLKHFIQDGDVSQALNAANITWIKDLNSTIANDFVTYLVSGPYKDSDKGKFVFGFLTNGFGKVFDDFSFDGGVSLEETIDKHMEFAHTKLNLFIAPAISDKDNEAHTAICGGPALNIRDAATNEEREGFFENLQNILGESLLKQYEINLPFASPIPGAAFEGFSAGMSDDELREHGLISNIGYLWNIANLAHLPEECAIALSRLRQAFVADERFQKLNSGIKAKILEAQIVPDNIPNDAAVIAAFNAILAGNDETQKERLIAIFNDILSRKGKAKEKLVDVYTAIVAQGGDARANLIYAFSAFQKDGVEKDGLREMLRQRLYQAAQNNENDKLTAIATALSADIAFQAAPDLDEVSSVIADDGEENEIRPMESFEDDEDEVVSDSAGVSKKSILFNDQSIVDYLLGQLKTFRPNIHVLGGVPLPGKIGSADAIETILNSSLPLCQKLQLLSDIGHGKLSNEKKISRRSLELRKFYQGLACFEGVSPDNMTAAFTDFLKKTGQIDSSVNNIEHHIQRYRLIVDSLAAIPKESFNGKAGHPETNQMGVAQTRLEALREVEFTPTAELFVELRSVDRFLESHGAAVQNAILHPASASAKAPVNSFSHYFERWMQYSIETGEPIRVNDLALIGAELTKEDVNTCFKLLWDKLPALHTDLIVDTLRVFLSSMFERSGKNGILLREVGKYITNALLIYPMHEVVNDELHESVRDLLINKMVSSFIAAAAIKDDQYLKFLGETLFSRREIGTKDQQPPMSNKVKDPRFSTDTNERVYSEGHSSGNDEDYKEKFKETKKERSIIKRPEKDTQKEVGVYKRHVVISLDNQKNIQRFFDFSQIKLYLSGLFDEADPLKETVSNVLESSIDFHVKLKFIGAIAQGKCDSHNFEQLADDKRKLYSGLKCFSEVELKEGVYLAFAKFLKSQKTIDNDVSSVDVHIQRYILIRQSLMSIPEDALNAAGVQGPYAFREKDVFENSLTVFEEINQFKKFLDKNKELLVKAGIANNKGDNTRFTKFFIRWVTFSINTKQPLQLEDLILIGVPPTLDEVVKCRDAIRAIPGLQESQKGQFITQLYACYAATIKQAPTFQGQFERGIDFALETGDVFEPEITAQQPATEEELRACHVYANEKLTLPKVPVDSASLAAQESVGSEQPAQELSKEEQQRNTFGLVLPRACSDTASTGVTATLPELINEAATSDRISDENTLKVAELCPENQLQKLATALKQFKVNTVTLFFSAQSIPTGMREVIRLIDEKKTAVEILLKLKIAAQGRGEKNMLGTRERATMDAYKTIDAFFSNLDISSSPRDATHSENPVVASGRVAMPATIDGLIKALNDVHESALAKAEAASKAVDLRIAMKL